MLSVAYRCLVITVLLLGKGIDACGSICEIIRDVMLQNAYRSPRTYEWAV